MSMKPTYIYEICAYGNTAYDAQLTYNASGELMAFVSNWHAYNNPHTWVDNEYITVVQISSSGYANNTITVHKACKSCDSTGVVTDVPAGTVYQGSGVKSGTAFVFYPEE